MKQATSKIILLLLLAITSITLSSSLLASPFIINDGEEDGEEIIINPDLNMDGKSHNRNPELIPISAIYYAHLSCIEVSFLYGLGDVQIDLTNVSTNATASTLVDSTAGNAFIPVTGGTGPYSITFITESGTTYSGFFIVTN